MAELMDELLDLIAEDAEALNCVDEVEGAREILEHGNSAERQRRVFSAARAGGAELHEAQCAVVKSLITEFTQDL